MLVQILERGSPTREGAFSCPKWCLAVEDKSSPLPETGLLCYLFDHAVS